MLSWHILNKLECLLKKWQQQQKWTNWNALKKNDNSNKNEWNVLCYFQVYQSHTSQKIALMWFDGTTLQRHSFTFKMISQMSSLLKVCVTAILLPSQGRGVGGHVWCMWCPLSFFFSFCLCSTVSPSCTHDDVPWYFLQRGYCWLVRNLFWCFMEKHLEIIILFISFKWVTSRYRQTCSALAFDFACLLLTPRIFESRGSVCAVSYTHLTLPTRRWV